MAGKLESYLVPDPKALTEAHQSGKTPRPCSIHLGVFEQAFRMRCFASSVANQYRIVVRRFLLPLLFPASGQIVAARLSYGQIQSHDKHDLRTSPM